MTSSEISDRINDFLRQYSGISYWYPLCTLKEDIPVSAYDLDKIYKDNSIERLAAVLRSCGICTVQSYQMQLGARDILTGNMLELLYEKDAAGYNFPWNVETYYFDGTEKWMIYVSHEGTIAFTGTELVRAAKENIPSGYLIGTSMPE